MFKRDKYLNQLILDEIQNLGTPFIGITYKNERTIELICLKNT